MTAPETPPGYRHGLDGKFYPGHPLPAAYRAQLVGFEHDLAHAGKSVREIVAALAEKGIRRSVGTVHADLTTWKCATCSGATHHTPEHSTDHRSADSK